MSDIPNRDKLINAINYLGNNQQKPATEAKMEATKKAVTVLWHLVGVSTDEQIAEIFKEGGA